MGNLKKGLFKATLTLLLFLGSTGMAWAEGLSGSGTKSDPYLISSVDDWNYFAESVNDGTFYFRKYVKLTTDLTGITTMAGSDYNCFCGYFDGDGHTIDLNLTGIGAYTAPLRSVYSAVIYNLNTTGTVDGKEHMRASGIVGYAEGDVLIMSCRSSVTIKSSIKGNGSHGGIVGKIEGSLTLVDCLFDGSFNTPDADYCGGMLGWREWGTVVFNNCLFAAKEIVCGTEYSGTFYQKNKSDHTLINCYYKTPFGEEQGTQTDATGAELASLLGNWEVSGNDVVPQKADLQDLDMANIDGMDKYYIYTTKPVYPDFDVIILNDTLTPGTHYTTVFTDSLGNIVSEPVERGKYMMSVIGKNGYHDTLTTTFQVIGPNTDADGNWLIESTEDWNQFAIMTDEMRYTFHDHVVKLTQDITITRMVGAKTWYPFSGYFDGEGHTITLGKTDDESKYITSPFYSLADATISRLNTTADINGIVDDERDYAGIASFAYDSVSINSCHSSIKVSQDEETDIYFGGLIAYASGCKLNINNCLFDGNILVSENMAGGFVCRLLRSKCNITNSLMAGSLEGLPSKSGLFIGKDSASYVNLDNCYYIIDYSPAQGTHTDATGQELRDLLGDGWTIVNGNVVPDTDDKNLYAAVINGIEDYYLYTGSAIDLRYSIFSSNMTALAPGTDYTAVIRNSKNETVDEVIESDTYTITFTGNNGYHGTRSLSFVVDYCPEGLSIDTRYNKADPGYYYVNTPADEDTIRITLTDDKVKSFKIYDLKNLYYFRWRSDGIMIITAPDGYYFKITGTFCHDGTGADILRINSDYDDGKYEPLFNKVFFSKTEYISHNIGTIYSTSRTIEIEHISSNSTPDNLDLTITLLSTSQANEITVVPSSHGELVADKNSACINDIVNLTATPDEGYVLDSIFVTQTDGSRLAVKGGNWYHNTASFRILRSAVTVQARFIPDNSDRIFVCMPYDITESRSTDTVYLTDDNVKTFKVYDNGGKDGEYKPYHASTLLLHAPEGYVFKLTGTIEIKSKYEDDFDYLCIYDGDSRTSPLLADTLYSTEQEWTVDIGTLYSTGQDLMLHLHSDFIGIGQGVDFTVTLVRADEVTAVQAPKAALESSEWYLPDGRLHQGAPTPGTLYLQPGRKVIIIDN